MSSETLYGIALTMVPILLSLVVHEFAHARTALAFGDGTAKAYGRCTLNPLAHLDPLGTVMMVLVGFGWAKPVPINPANMQPPRLGQICVSIAGPASNVGLAILCALGIRLLVAAGATVDAAGPVKPAELALFLLAFGVIINLNLAVFNLIPLFPLDGHHIGRETLPAGSRQGYMRWQMQYGRYVFLALWIGPVLLRQVANVHVDPIGWYLSHVTVPTVNVLLGKTAVWPAFDAFSKFQHYLFWRH
jgi:Zn-dependent protease